MSKAGRSRSSWHRIDAWPIGQLYILQEVLWTRAKCALAIAGEVEPIQLITPVITRVALRLICLLLWSHKQSFFKQEASCCLPHRTRKTHM